MADDARRFNTEQPIGQSEVHVVQKIGRGDACLDAQSLHKPEASTYGGIGRSQSRSAQDVEAGVSVLIERGDLERTVRRAETGVKPIEVGTAVGWQRATANAVGELKAAVVQTVDGQLRGKRKASLQRDHGAGMPVAGDGREPSAARAARQIVLRGATARRAISNGDGERLPRAL